MPFTARVFSRLIVFRLSLIGILLLPHPAAAQAKQENPSFTRRNTFGIFAAYSNDSSHMLLGIAESRQLVNIGVSYNRRLWFNRYVDWEYSGELLPVALESDPLQIMSTTFTYTNPPLTFTTTTTMPTTMSCQSSSGSGSVPNGGPTYTYVSTCSRRWVVGEAFSPIGFQWNFWTNRRLQPFFVGHGGYMYSSQTIPVQYAGNFNFTFDLGLGAEFFHTRSRSLRLEYRYHHISNDWTAAANPGVDSGMVQVSYAFGR